MPAFVVIPYEQFLREYGKNRDMIPNEVVGKIIMDEQNPILAWRDYLGLTQAEVARRADMSQTALAHIESGEHKACQTTLGKLANALGITPEELIMD